MGLGMVLFSLGVLQHPALLHLRQPIGRDGLLNLNIPNWKIDCQHALSVEYQNCSRLLDKLNMMHYHQASDVI
jgi:hypothetical protein